MGSLDGLGWPETAFLIMRKGRDSHALSAVLFPTHRFELSHLLLIHEFPGLATAFNPVLLPHGLGFKLAALSLVAVPRLVRRRAMTPFQEQNDGAWLLFLSDDGSPNSTPPRLAR